MYQPLAFLPSIMVVRNDHPKSTTLNIKQPIVRWICPNRIRNSLPLFLGSFCSPHKSFKDLAYNRYNNRQLTMLCVFCLIKLTGACPCWWASTMSWKFAILKWLWGILATMPSFQCHVGKNLLIYFVLAGYLHSITPLVRLGWYKPSLKAVEVYPCEEM